MAPSAWLALGAAVAVLLAGLAWGLLGKVDRETAGVGILTRAPYVSSVESDRIGVVTTEALAVGSTVRAGDVIAEVADSAGGVTAARTPVSGRIASWDVAQNEPVDAGERIALVEPNTPLVGYLFVSAAEGKRIKAGMPVRLSPGGTSRQDDGLLQGTVSRVLPYPVDGQRVGLLTAQPHLVEEFLQNEARIEVDIVLDVDAQTPSGLRWTNGNGPSSPLTGGTVMTGSVVIGTERPLSLLLAD